MVAITPIWHVPVGCRCFTGTVAVAVPLLSEKATNVILCAGFALYHIKHAYSPAFSVVNDHCFNNASHGNGFLRPAPHHSLCRRTSSGVVLHRSSCYWRRERAQGWSYHSVSVIFLLLFIHNRTHRAATHHNMMLDPVVLCMLSPPLP